MVAVMLLANSGERQPKPRRTIMSRRHIVALTALAALIPLVSDASFAQTTPSNQTVNPITPITLPPYNPVINPAKFSAKITNKYFPLVPGTVFVYEGNRDGLTRRAEHTVTSDTRKIMGVDCIVVRDIAFTNTEMVEKTVDWYAQDSLGNVWYFGEDTAEYKNGKVTSTHGTWMAGVDGALPGIIMQASPKLGEGYRQEYRPGAAEDYAKVVQVNAGTLGPMGKYDNVVVTEDTDLLDVNKFEHKSFAPDVGFIGSSGLVNGHQEEIGLVKILKSN